MSEFDTTTPVALALDGPLQRGRLVVEASAGTGKTYSLSALVARHLAERGDLTAANLLVVTFTRAAAAELRDRTRRAIITARDALRAGERAESDRWIQPLLEGTSAEVATRLGRLEAAVTSFDDATITTIHGFCQQALRQLGLRSGAAMGGEMTEGGNLLVEEVCRDLVVGELLDDITRLSLKSDTDPSSALSKLVTAVKNLLGNPDATVLPGLGATNPKADPAVLDRWITTATAARDEVLRRRAARGEMGYDDLVNGLHDALTGPQGESVGSALRERYGLVMVDEFQDTDPRQWKIFAAAFPCTDDARSDLITVGDPKQAIYRFRGADVHAYLEAVEGQQAAHLGVNYRSDADLVAATNALLSGHALGDARIVVSPVAARDGAPDRTLVGVDAQPLSLRWVPIDDAWRGKKGPYIEPIRRAITHDLARYVVDLLENGRLASGSDAPASSVAPSDIAILVGSHSEAQVVVSALGRVGVPAVRSRTGSVFDSPAMGQWQILLGALENPSHAPTVRAVGLGVFLRRPAADLDPQRPESDEVVASMQRIIAGWAQLMAERPFLAWYDEIRADGDMVVSVLGSEGGERLLTDLDHIAELLAAEAGSGRLSPAGARRLLQQMTLETASDSDTGPQMRRIDSDADAVQVTTLHGSKGLEYPIVLIPFAWRGRDADKSLFNDGHGRRTIDLAPSLVWGDNKTADGPKAREHWAKISARGDALRLLYVGLTRGEHHTAVWWANHGDAKSSALNTVLFDRVDGVPVDHDLEPEVGKQGAYKVKVPTAAIDDADVEQAMEAVRQLDPDNIGVVEFAPSGLPRPWTGPADAVASSELRVADRNDRVVGTDGWRRWSFSSIKAEREGADHGLHAPIEIVPVVGGADEGDESSPGGLDPIVESSAGDTPTGLLMPWSDTGAGTAFGTLVHEVMERLDPTSDDLDADVDHAVGMLLARHRLRLDPVVVAAGVLAALRTPLGPVFDGLSLADIPATDRLAELDFEITIAGADGRVPVAAIGDVLLETLDADDPMRGYAHELADGRLGVVAAGYLRGSIDAVFRIADPVCGHRYVVVDYKTNRLHERGAADPLAAYHPSLLPAEMAHTDYALQSLLYSVALHRYLRWRVPGYRPEQHLGGIGYLFMRGMIGPATPVADGAPYGVFGWRPPAAAIIALDQLLAGTAGRDAA